MLKNYKPETQMKAEATIVKEAYENAKTLRANIHTAEQELEGLKQEVARLKEASKNAPGDADLKAAYEEASKKRLDHSAGLNSLKQQWNRYSREGGGDVVRGITAQYIESAKQWNAKAEEARDTTHKAKLYLGRVDDVRNHTHQGSETPNPNKEVRRLAADVWSLGVNDAWVEGGIDLPVRFKLVTQFQEPVKALLSSGKNGQEFLDALKPQAGQSPIDPNLWDVENNRSTVTARELAQLLDAGYTFHEGPKANGTGNKQQMLPPNYVPDALRPVTDS
ncbi:hypothetical protein JQX13_46020 [Archangium violaceum]|uniref:hypothetical protein n=1 Tax=Archangium violaceum TaxID=83451 RepID=UPI00193B0482|nr:hypothetical protein [Archangium violaceum]QRK07321.1 hypothetical protein JQX13_46020 [Archangium violaceum]